MEGDARVAAAKPAVAHPVAHLNGRGPDRPARLRVSAGAILNALAWAVIVGLAAIAVIIAQFLGFFGLLIIGVVTWFVCSEASLDEDVPVSSPAVFRAQMSRRGSPEEQAARRLELAHRTLPLRFYGRCGMALAVVGLAGFVWQHWNGGGG